MTRRANVKDVKGGLLRVVMAAALAALIAIPATRVAAAGEQLWSVVVHIEYPNGFVYEHAFATGVPVSDLPAILQACGSAHRFGSAVRYHCFPVLE